jgi:hypothetical protein
LPFGVPVGQDGAEEADDGGVVGEGALDPGSALDFLIALSRGLVGQI